MKKTSIILNKHLTDKAKIQCWLHSEVSGQCLYEANTWTVSQICCEKHQTFLSKWVTKIIAV